MIKVTNITNVKYEIGHLLIKIIKIFIIKILNILEVFINEKE